MKWLVTDSGASARTISYTAWLEKGGIQPLIVTPADGFIGKSADCSALLLSGGADVEPRLYGAPVTHPATYGTNARRDAMEISLIKHFLDARKPVFGICRGIQVIAVHFGCRLIQHIPDILKAEEEAHYIDDEADAIHSFIPETLTQLGKTMSDVRQINSSHHQSVRSTGGTCLKLAGRSRCGCIEALEYLDSGITVSAVQWHPERMEYALKASSGLLAYWISLAYPQLMP